MADPNRISIPQAVEPPPRGLIVEQDEIEDDEVEEVEEQERPEREPKGSGKTVWVGSKAAPDKASDGISDLFEFDSDAESADVDDLVEVDFEKDILDAGPDGTLDDLTDVSQEDIMGSPPRKKRARPVRRIVRRRPPMPPTMGGFNA